MLFLTAHLHGIFLDKEEKELSYVNTRKLVQLSYSRNVPFSFFHILLSTQPRRKIWSKIFLNVSPTRHSDVPFFQGIVQVTVPLPKFRNCSFFRSFFPGTVTFHIPFSVPFHQIQNQPLDQQTAASPCIF